LGRSLGVNNLPAKVCTYSCVYCQAGRTTRMKADRRSFFPPERILQETWRRAAIIRAASEAIDYITFVPEGEPTLDINLEQEILLLKELEIPVGVITNSSLLGRPEVREALYPADWVSLKLDTVDEAIWRKINRPHRSLALPDILDGMLAFAEGFAGKLATETMLVRDLNDETDHLKETADFIRKLNPAVSCLSLPLRPPAESWVSIPNEGNVNRAYQIFSDTLKRVECLIVYEGDAFSGTGDVEKDILGIAAVHPMREQALRAVLSRSGASWEVIERLVARGDLEETEYEGHKYFRRRTPNKSLGYGAALRNRNDHEPLDDSPGGA